jgi:hypothetical protein
MSKHDRVNDYTVPKTRWLRRRLLWQLRRMRDAVDVETLEVFEHELAAHEREGVAQLERQRTRNRAASAARLADARAREELVRAAILRTEAQVQRAELAAERLETVRLGRDPDLRDYA